MSDGRLRDCALRKKCFKRRLMWLRLTTWSSMLTARCFTISTKLVETVKAKIFLSLEMIRTWKRRRLLHLKALKRLVRVTIRLQKSRIMSQILQALLKRQMALSWKMIRLIWINNKLEAQLRLIAILGAYFHLTNVVQLYSLNQI